MRVVVIGSGLGGLAVAIRLGAQGHEVIVAEQRNQAGGCAGVFRQDGFVFDAGPTILTAPWMIDALFTLAGQRRAERLCLVPLDPFYRVRFEDGSELARPRREADLLSRIAELAPGDVAGYERFAARAGSIFDAAFPLVDRPFNALGAMARAVPDLLRVQAWRSVGTMVDACVRDPRLRQFLSFHALLIGGHPYRASSIYALIPVLEQRWGVWFAMGGMAALVQALVDLARGVGVELRLEAPVRQVCVDEQTGRTTGVELGGGERLAAEAVVSNADVTSTYRHLVPSRVRRVNTDARLARLRYGMSVFILCFGTDRRYDDVAHHEILMGPRYRGLLDDIFVRRRLAPDCSVYLHRPTATDPSLAPPGCDAWYALSPVPHLGARIDWEREGDAYRDRIVEFLERRCLPGLRRHIVTERRLDPRYFRDEMSTHLGGAFSMEPTLGQSAWFRPHSVSEDVPNLYFVGAGTHPGAGIPGVLSSAKIVAELIGDGSSDR